MSAPTDNLIRVFTEEELTARKADVVARLERRFGSLERALEREEDWDYDEDEAILFSECQALPLPPSLPGGYPRRASRPLDNQGRLS